MDLSISVVNYNTKNLVKQFIKNCVKQVADLSYEIIIIDNGSTDGSADFIKKEILPNYPSVRMIQEKNRGFGAGHNRGVRESSGKFILIANPDLVIIDGALQELRRFLNEDSRRGIVAPKLIYPDLTVQKSCFAFPAIFTPLYRRTALGKTGRGIRYLARYELDGYDRQTPRRVDWAVGACLLIRRETWNAVRGFDERYFLYCEDIDICKTTWARGYEVWYNPLAKMIHFHKRMSAQKRWWQFIFNKTARIHIASHIKYIKKWRDIEHKMPIAKYL